MQVQNFLIRKTKLRGLILAVTALTMTFSVSAQTGSITLPLKELNPGEVFRAIESQTPYGIAADMTQIRSDHRIRITRSPMTITSVLDKMFENTDMTYVTQGSDIVIYRKSDPKTTALLVQRNVNGRINDENGRPLEGVSVEILDVAGQKTATSANGYFQLSGVPSGNHLAKLTSADGSIIRYREVTVSANRDAEVSLIFNNELLTASKDRLTEIQQPVKSTAYYVPNTAPRAWDEPKSEYSFVPSGQVNNHYLPKFGIKTNLLYLATTTPNVALEFGLKPQWTLDVTVGVNLWDLNSRNGGIRHGLIQPEVRYWFCQRFEKHFVGLHGIYGEYQIQDIDLAPFGNDLTGKRYDGWGVGAGISYGYHLPMSKRWAWEFTVGVGYVYLEYDKYNCGNCDTFLGSKGKHYFGPTKAGISLIYMLK